MAQLFPEEVTRAYELGEEVGSGAYGSVWAAQHIEDDYKVAIKHVHSAFESEASAKQLYREVVILLRLRSSCVVSLLDVILDNRAAFLVFEMAEMDLYGFMRHHPTASFAQKATLAFQLFSGLDYLHASNIVHRDLKPENLLIYTGGTQLKIADFGLARDLPTDDLDASPLSSQVITIWYRPPELFLSSSGRYGSEVDVWSAGCIVAYLFLRRAVIKGNDAVQMLLATVAAVGCPTQEDLADLPPTPSDLTGWDKPRTPGAEQGRGQIDRWLEDRGLQAVQRLVRRVLRYSPSKRPSAAEALADEFFAEYRRPTTTGVLAPVLLRSGDHGAEFYREELKKELERRPKDKQPHTPRGSTLLRHSESFLGVAPLSRLGPFSILPDIGLDLDAPQGADFLTVRGPEAVTRRIGDKVVARFSKPVEVNLPAHARRAISIPADATHFSFAYPAEKVELPVDGHTPNPWLSFLRYGGFIYFNANGDLIQQNGIAIGVGLSFAGPYRLPGEAKSKLRDTQRLRAVTIPELQTFGAQQFAWLDPNEHEVLHLPYPIPYGGFAYVLGDSADCYFAIDGQ